MGEGEHLVTGPFEGLLLIMSVLGLVSVYADMSPVSVKIMMLRPSPSEPKKLRHSHQADIQPDCGSRCLRS